MSDVASSTIRVLLVDADLHLRTVLAQLLDIQEGLQIVATAASRQEALDEARQHRPEVVVLASRVQGGDSLSLLSALQEQLPNCAAVFLTADADGIPLADALSAKARAVLPRGSPGQQVAEGIRTVHTGGRYIDGQCVADAIGAGHTIS
ncbi:response regulator [Streptomyces sp. NPDC058674]|uniref:response regulator n=1 Tax=Streptomyces sp. NPDC058674 TaxID=3346592 RepID=UPI003663D931